MGDMLKKVFKYIGIITICLMSFYYTEKVAMFIRSKNPVMITLSSNQKDLEVSSIDSTIIDNMYIIPGLNGKKVNLNASLSRMNNSYDESKVVFYAIKPKVSLNDNKDKIIIRGNGEKKSVSLVFENENVISNYLVKNNKKIDLLIREEKYNKAYELINHSNHLETYNNVDRFLNRNKLNTKICVIKKDSIPSLCKNKYIVKPSMFLNNSNFNSNIYKIDSGEIILVENINSEEMQLLLNYLSSKRLDIVYLSELIKEER